jgi:hypothetical protein
MIKFIFLIVPVITILTFVIIFIICDAIQDAITWNFETSIFRNCNPNFCNPVISWKNKYKDSDPTKGRKFPGSTTFLVWLTDLWHLMKFIKMVSLWTIITILTGLWWILPAGLALHGILFEIVYKFIRKSRNS